MECVSGAWIRMSSRVLPQRLAAVDGHNEEKHGPQKAPSRRILDGKWRHIEAWGILTLAAGLLITLLLHASVERHDTLLRTECLMKPSSHYSAHHSSMHYSCSSDAWNRWRRCFQEFYSLITWIRVDCTCAELTEIFLVRFLQENRRCLLLFYYYFHFCILGFSWENKILFSFTSQAKIFCKGCLVASTGKQDTILIKKMIFAVFMDRSERLWKWCNMAGGGAH